MQNKPIDFADISWSQDTPMSRTYGDIYFHDNQGIAESEHVFVRGNQLPQRFAQISEREAFIIGETGFGTGLNFLTACHLWLNTAPKTAKLHYISAELHPLSAEDMKVAFDHFPQFAYIADEILPKYPKPIRGLHAIELFEGRVSLSLIYDDAYKGFKGLDIPIDAWFLDGFTPSKNPQMWSSDLFNELARLSKETTPAATFTVAGIVRKGLTEAGFSFERTPGFGKKLEMIQARYHQNFKTHTKTPWFDRELPSPPKHIAIIGAGLAGASTAFALAKRGIHVTVFDKANEIAAGGSGNQQGALYAKLPAQDNDSGAIHSAGLAYTLNLLRELDPEQSFWQESGVYQLATTAKEQARQAELMQASSYAPFWLTETSAKETSLACGETTHCPGLYMAEAGWVAPKALCQRLLNHPNISVELNTHVTKLETSNTGVQLTLSDQADNTSRHFDKLVICNAADAKHFPQANFLPVKPIRGQVSLLDTPNTHLKHSVCGAGYITPPIDNVLSFGATFDIHNQSTEPDQESHRKNIGYLAQTLPELAGRIAIDKLTARVSFRCSTSDYLPIVGQLPKYEAFIVEFDKLRDDKHWDFHESYSPTQQHIFINVGHGSKGLITTPISGQIIASLILAEPYPLEKPLVNRLNPARFIVRSLVRDFRK